MSKSMFEVYLNEVTDEALRAKLKAEFSSHSGVARVDQKVQIIRSSHGRSHEVHFPEPRRPSDPHRSRPLQCKWLDRIL